VPVVGGLTVDGAGQVEALDDGSGTEVEAGDEVGRGVVVAGAEGVDGERHGAGFPDGVGDLDLGAAGHPLPDDLPGEPAAEVGAAPVHFGWILPAERAAAVPGEATVGIHHDLAARDPGVGGWAADGPLAGGVDGHQRVEGPRGRPRRARCSTK
jgi:hypothetical protein